MAPAGAGSLWTWRFRQRCGQAGEPTTCYQNRFYDLPRAVKLFFYLPHAFKTGLDDLPRASKTGLYDQPRTLKTGFILTYQQDLHAPSFHIQILCPFI